VRDRERRQRLHTVTLAAYQRAFGYASATLMMALAAGLFGYAMARMARVPGPAPLGIWVGLWDLVPVAGVVVGAAPILGLAAVVSPERAIVLALAFIGYQVLENYVVQRRVEALTLRLGPFLTLAAGLVGLELSGLAGSLLLVLAVAIAVVTANELSRERAAATAATPATAATAADSPPPSDAP
jgi:predicted PurR-regulated permease PerM